jgi:hypothetical protein
MRKKSSWSGIAELAPLGFLSIIQKNVLPMPLEVGILEIAQGE